MVKSLDELKKVRQESYAKVALRKHGQLVGDKIEGLGIEKGHEIIKKRRKEEHN